MSEDQTSLTFEEEDGGGRWRARRRVQLGRFFVLVDIDGRFTIVQPEEIAGREVTARARRDRAVIPTSQSNERSQYQRDGQNESD